MSSPKNIKLEEMSPSSKVQLDIEETMPQSFNKIHNFDSGHGQIQGHSQQFSKSISHPASDNIMEEGEVVPSKAQREQQEKVTKIPENKCKVKGHKNEDLSFVCTTKGCDEILLCKKCKRKHAKDHQSSIKLLDDWFNSMFGRRVEDSDNNKVSRKCGMNLGKLQDQLKTFQSEIEARKQTIEKQTQQFIEMITTYIKKKHSECVQRLDGHYQMKIQLLEEYQQTYKKLKGLNRFTILENLKRQHNPNSDQPPLIPIQSILKFLLENEKQYTDSSQIENQHKGFSKLIRDTESLEQQLSNETKQFQKLSSTDEGKPDYLIRDSPVIQRIQDYIDFLYFFEKGIPKKTQSFFRSGTLNFDEEDYQQQLNQQSAISNTNNSGIPSVNLSFSNQCQRMQIKPNLQYKNSSYVSGDSTGRRRLTAEEVLKFSSSRQQIQGGNILKQIQQQDEGDFIIQKQKEQKLQSSGNDEEEDEEKEEIEYECLVQENFNNAQFIDFKNDSIRVFGDSSLQLYNMNNGLFNKKDNFKAQQQIISGDQEMYEIGALEEVQFYQMDISQNGLIYKQNNSVLPENQKSGQMLIDDVNLMDLNQNSYFMSNQSKKQLPILIIGLKSDPAKIEIWDMDRNEKIVQQLQAHDCSITCIQVLEVVPNKSILFAVGSYDGIIKTWLFTCTPPEANGLQLETHIQPQLLDKKQFVFSLTQQQIMKQHTDFVTCMIIFKIKDDPAKEYLISAGSDKKMILWDWKPNNSEQTQNEGAVPTANTLQSQENISSDKQGVGSTNNSETETKQEEAKKKPMFLKNKIKISSLKSSSSLINSSNKENQNSLTGNLNDKTMKKPIKVMSNVHLDKINCFEKLDEGFLATGSSDNTIKIWDMDTQSEQKVLQNKYIVNNICRLKRGTLVCSANNVKMSIYLVNIWNWELGQIIGTIKGHTNRITKIQVIPSIFEGSPNDPYYNKIITCERNKVIRVWKQSNIDSDYGRRMNSQEDEINTSPSSIRSYNRGYSYSYRNPAEEFLNYYHLEMDPSLTPKLNMARVVSQTAIPQGSYDKTPIGNILRGPNFNGQTTPQNQSLYFTSQQNTQGVRSQQYPSFSQQNNLLQQQYMQLTQQVQQVNSIQSIVRSQGTNFTPPKNNQVFQFSSDDQNIVSFSPLISSTSNSINNLSSPQLNKPQTPIIQPLQLSSQHIHPQLQGSINQQIPFISSIEQLNGANNNNYNGINNIFQQSGNISKDLQSAIDQAIIQTVNQNNIQSFDQELQSSNLATSLELNMDQQSQQSLLEQAMKDQKQRMRTYSEVGHMLAPLEEANESEYNSPIDSQNSINTSSDNVMSFSIDNTKYKYSRENSKEMQDVLIYQASPASKYYEKENGLINESKIFKNCGSFSQIPERSPGSESSNSSSGNEQPQLSKEGSNNFQNDFVVQQKLQKSLSASPNAPDYLKLDFCSDQSTNDSTKDIGEKNPQKESKNQISYSIKLNGVQKYGSMEINGTNYELEDTKQNTTNNINHIETVLSSTGSSNVSETNNSNKNQENVNQQNLLNENQEQQKQEPAEISQNQLVPPDEKKVINYSQSAPNSPSLPSSNPLLKSKAAMLQKTKKSSRNIFQN